MAITLTNVAMLKATHQMSSVSRQLGTVMERLSSGFRINSAKDDPAGLQIANRLTSQINGYKQGNRNLNDGISLAQTMEGAIDEIVNMMQRIRTLAVQSANGTYTTADRRALNEESKQYCEEISRIAKNTSFGGVKILDGLMAGFASEDGSVKIQVSGMAGDTISIPKYEYGLSMSGMMSHIGVQDASCIIHYGDEYAFSLSTQQNARDVIGCIDQFISSADSYRGMLGATQNRFESAIRLNETMEENLSDARSRIKDTDYAETISEYQNLLVRQQVIASIFSQVKNSKNLILQLLQG